MELQPLIFETPKIKNTSDKIWFNVTEQDCNSVVQNNFAGTIMRWFRPGQGESEQWEILELEDSYKGKDYDFEKEYRIQIWSYFVISFWKKPWLWKDFWSKQTEK